MFKQFRRVAIACAVLDAARAIEAHYIHLWLRDTGEKWKPAIDVVLLPPGVKTLG